MTLTSTALIRFTQLGSRHEGRGPASPSASPDRRPRRLRQALVTAGLTTVLAGGGLAFPMTASADVPTGPAPAMHSPALVLAGFCPFGHHKGRKGCRGGSVGDTLNDNGYSIATNVGCGLVGVGAGAATANPAVGFGAGAACGVLLDDEPAG